MELKDTWTVYQTIKLINSYKGYPNLWDHNHRYYKNKTLRKTCLKNIAKVVSEVKPGTSINDVRAKLKTLRSQYGKEKRRREAIVFKRGLKEYKPKLWCYDEIKFIDIEVDGDDDLIDNSILDETMDYEPPANETQAEEYLEEEANNAAVEEKVEKRGRPSRFPSWTKEQTFTLLLHLKQCPLLYDTTHPLYSHPIHRMKAFREILGKLKTVKPNVTVPDMRAKLKTLRSQYLKEKQLQKMTMERRDRVQYIPKLWCFDHLKFLDERGKFLEEEQEVTTSSQEEEQQEQEQDFQMGEEPDDCYVVENENEIYVKSFDDSDADEPNETPIYPIYTSNVGGTTRSILHQKCLSLVESLTEQMNREIDNSYQPDDIPKTPQALLGRMVEEELSKVSEDIFEEVKWKIIKVLEEASMKHREIKAHNC